VYTKHLYNDTSVNKEEKMLYTSCSYECRTYEQIEASLRQTKHMHMSICKSLFALSISVHTLTHMSVVVAFKSKRQWLF